MTSAPTTATDESAQQEDHLEQLFDEASRRIGGVLERSYLIAGLAVRMRYAGPAMLGRIGPALAHLEDDSGAAVASLTINVWDSASTGSEAPPLPPASPGAPQGAKYYFGDDRFQASYQPSSGALSVLDSSRALAWYWCPGPSEMPDWEAAASIRQILHWWLPRHGVFELHGGAVGTESGGVLLVGRGGSGKSTAALSTLGSSRLSYASDDYTGVRVEPSPWAYSLYSTGKLEPHHVARLPHLRSAVANSERLGSEEKAVFHVHEHFPSSVVLGFPLKAILLPRITERTTPRIVPASPTAALTALAPSTLLQLHPPTPHAWEAMSKLVRAVPSHYLELGSDISAIPETIADFLTQE
jgi:hypothetical protein